MKNIPITLKFLLIMGLFGFFTLAVALYSASVMSDIDGGYSDLIEHESVAAVSLARANRNFQTIRATVGDIIMASDPKILNSAKAEFDVAHRRFIDLMDTAIAAAATETSLPDIKAQALKVIDVTCSDIIAAGLSTTDPTANQKIQREFYKICQPEIVGVSEAITAATAKLTDKQVTESAKITSTTEHAILMVFFAILAGFMLVCAIGYAVVRATVVKPISALSATMDILAKGDLEASVQGADRRDEIGAMARAVQVFKDTGVKARDLEAQTAQDRHMTEAERARAAEQDRRRAGEMAEATAGLAAGLKQLANGDLGVELSQSFAADFDGLRLDFNAAVSQLRDTLASVAEATRSIDSGTREISSGASDLSKRTEQQAASLEETAAALDEITANVSSSSKLTDEARTVAQAANQSAAHSAGVVSHAEEAMQRIEQSSQQISNIIGVIDEIAFQTNLLALNAGVEAARAGDAGKGFAVVAQEVRELAQRSAKAAKEIKGLIQNSTSEVENGVKLVRDTGEALKTIGGYIGTINRHMESIATSAREQSTGLAEVNTAVNQMDQTTQQNAAMVEQSTAAAASLAQEAGKLRDLVAQFRLEHGAAAQTAALRQTAAAMARPAAASTAVSRPVAARPAAKAVSHGNAAVKDDWEEF
ncbi:methyl-accepting chemotaxis protein [Rhizobium sp. SG_E_25_P2]|uniref:methyl-accepting chemotaxis protein n=1 Tax=Rhizobium sp. SG_E_25_P2 TaxID=2879942 RepID=UPI002475133D|nr:methyl-accepting chemotaxis protein [Rhizobium sp. SG_E_25_P2]MDH6266574.1 methyl-accepting chemotaxis protein [Rhizobium sp. SG_E_25_P2]